MAANVESMFYVRETPWHGLGTKVMEAPTSKDALSLAGLDWKVLQEPIYTENEEAFAFTDGLLGEGVRYETAGSLQGGKKVWMLAHLPHEYIISGERISPYLLFSNTHDGSGAIKVALTPVRVVCNNTLNLALNTASIAYLKNKKVSNQNIVNVARIGQLLGGLQPGDVIHVVSVNRFPSVSAFVAFANAILKLGASLRILDNPCLDVGNRKIYRASVSEHLKMLAELERMHGNRLLNALRLNEAGKNYVSGCVTDITVGILAKTYSSDGILHRGS